MQMLIVALSAILCERVMKRNNQREHYRHHPRLFWIDHEIRAGRYPNNPRIAAKFEISLKTAQRIMEFLRDQQHAPLAYSPENRGWYYTDPSYKLSAVEMSEGDLIAILLAEKLSHQYRGTALGSQVEKAFSKVLKALTEEISIDLEALTEAHSFEAAATADLAPALFAQVGHAIQKKLCLEMEYYTASTKELKWRTVNPLHLRNHLGDWYLIGWDHFRAGIRDFHCGRIRQLKVREETFTPPENFDQKTYFESGFSMIRGGEEHTVEIIFDEYQSRWMRERGKFHPTEEREELPNGKLRMRMQVTALDGVQRFVMQYGSHVEVIQPAILRQSIVSELSNTLGLYEKNESPDGINGNLMKL